MKRNHFLLIILLIVSLLCGACSHPLDEPFLNKTSPKFHGNSSLNCAICHDLILECSECHFGASGIKSPSDWNHGTVPHDQLASSETVCNKCHDLNRSYGNGPNSCHDCHGSSTPHAIPLTDHGLQGKTDLAYCQQCHAQPSDSGAGSNPRFNVPVGSLTFGCETSGCHADQTAHPLDWLGPDATSHQTAGNMANTCALCHGIDLIGGIGPACAECHTADSPLIAHSCTSCHDKPPTGTISPNTDGSHSDHNLLTGVTGSCNTCHQGGGSQTVQHYDTVVDVAFSGYNAKSGTGSYDVGSATCFKISCHGGKNTPQWFSGSINVNGECSACHALGGEYNSYVSGKHKKHVQDKGHPCTECHDTSKLQPVHFNDLNTPQMNEADQTIVDGLNYNGDYCLFTCHFQNKDKQHDEEKRWW